MNDFGRLLAKGNPAAEALCPRIDPRRVTGRRPRPSEKRENKIVDEFDSMSNQEIEAWLDERAEARVRDTLVRAIAKQHRWQCGTNLRAWLFTIMHNQNVNVVRASVRQGVAVAIDEASPYLVARSDPTGALSLRDFDRALARIPAEQRRVILLIGLEGITYDEAAAILDVPIGTIRSRLSRGRESLRKLIDWRDVEATNGAAITSAKPKHRQVAPEVARAQNSDFQTV